MILKAYLIAAYFLLIGYHVRVERERLGKKTDRVYVHLGTMSCVEPVSVLVQRKAIDVLSETEQHFTRIIPAIHGAHMEIDAI